jgi:pimeloyl-ACP methyl ester carboxylesterase
MLRIERRFVDVAGRRVHYRRAGAGPPVVMLHPSPASSAILAEEMQAAGAHFTCFALDTPGFGDSDPLPGEELTVAALAAATEAAMKALALPPCPVFGTHSGAAIALELGAGFPDSVTGLVLDAVPIFTAAERSALFENYFVCFPADPLGGHFTSVWMRFRDQFTWFPWPARSPACLNPGPRPTPDAIHQWVAMYYKASGTYLPAYRAILSHGEAAAATAATLALPATFMATEDDMLFSHLDRLPPLLPTQSILRLPPGPAGKYAAMVRALQALPPRRPSPLPPPTRAAGLDPALQFLDTEDGQIFLRCYGNAENPPVILLHDTPGTGLALQTLARDLGDIAYAILPDLPGTGESGAPELGRDILEAAAELIAAIADTLALEGLTLAATGTGCAVAARFATRADPRLAAIVVHNMRPPSEAAAAAIAPEIPLAPEGTHFLTMWLMLRDAQIYQPWYEGSVAAQRSIQGNFDATWLHEQTCALMVSRETYHRLPRAAYGFDTPEALAGIQVPVHHAPETELTDTIRAVMNKQR